MNKKRFSFVTLRFATVAFVFVIADAATTTATADVAAAATVGTRTSMF